MPASVKDGASHRLLCLGYGGGLGRDLPAPHVVVPGARHQEVVGDGGRGEGEGGDGVIRGAGHLDIFVGVGHGGGGGGGAEGCVG